MKECTTCTTLKDFSAFYKRTRATDGYQSTCKDCRKAMDAASYLKYDHRRQSIKDRRDRNRDEQIKLMRRYKSFCGCKLCGEKEAVALDLHHTDPSGKDANPSNLTAGSRERLVAEIRKCVVLCSNCHRKVHAGILHLPV